MVVKMKVIFLDIDGVLNSYQYDRQRKEGDGNIDLTRLELLKEIIQSTDAKIVLSTSWRKHWEPDYLDCDFIGKELTTTFYNAKIEIFDKTPITGTHRADEISAWIESHMPLESFVILDDIVFGWGELNCRVVHTDFRIGRGLENIHVKKAIEILNTPLPATH